MPNRDHDIVAHARLAQKEQEFRDIELFLDAYQRATGERVKIAEKSDRPDAICHRPDGSIVGVEHTQIRRSPDDAFWQEVLYHCDEMDFEEAFHEIGRLLLKKAERRESYQTEQTILMIAICESDFRLAISMACEIPVEDFQDFGFQEVWLADFMGVRSGAHREVQVFGLWPEEYRYVTGRSDCDQKPFG